MYFFELGYALRRARLATGTTQDALATRVGLGRTTVNQLETGMCPDLGVKKVMRLLEAVGLELALVPAARKKAPDYLKMACISANVSYREQITPDTLVRALLTGHVPKRFRPHVRAVMEEVPSVVLSGAIQQVAGSASRPERITTNVRLIADSLGCRLSGTA